MVLSVLVCFPSQEKYWTSCLATQMRLSAMLLWPRMQKPWRKLIRTRKKLLQSFSHSIKSKVLTIQKSLKPFCKELQFYHWDRTGEFTTSLENSSGKIKTSSKRQSFRLKRRCRFFSPARNTQLGLLKCCTLTLPTCASKVDFLKKQ